MQNKLFFLFLFFGLFVGFLIGGNAYSQDDQEIEFLQRKCKQMYQEKDYKQTVSICSKTVMQLKQKKLPSHDSEFLLAMGLFQTNNFSQALKTAKEILPFDNNGDYYALYGEVLLSMNDYSAALNYLRQAVQKNPRNAVNQKNLCRSAQFSASFEEALKACNASINIDSDYAEAYFERGNILQSLHQFTQALFDYDRAIAIRPSEPRYLINRGSTKQSLGDYESALYDFNQAISAKGNNAYAYYNRGISHIYLNDLEKARKDFSTAIALNKNYAEAYFNRGITYQLLQEIPQACKDFEMANTSGIADAKKMMDSLDCKQKKK